MTHPSSSDRSIRDVVASADQRRRSRDAFRLIARLSPYAAGLAFAVAVVARIAGWRSTPSLLLLGASAAVLVTILLAARRSRPVTDAIARRVDADAALDGELHSAHWFEARDGAAEDDWTRYHLSQAATRAQGVAWDRLYPPVAARGTWLTAAAMAVGVVALAVVLPVQPARAVSQTEQLTAAITAALPTLSPELQMQLQALLAGLQTGQLSPEELKAALEGLKKLDGLDPALQKALAELAKSAKEAPKDLAQNKKADPKDLNRDIKKDGAKDDDGRSEDTRWAEEEQASKAANAAANKSDAQEKSGDGQSETSKDAGDEAASASTSMSMQMVRESASQSDASQAMMMEGGGGASGDSTPGAGGKSGEKPNQALAALLAEALKKETVEAAADNLGENIDKEDIRRKTEAGKSAMAYSKAAAATFDKSRAAAPPPVPEARRPLVQSYFVRKSGDRH